VATDQPLVVGDAREDPVLRSNLAIPDLGVIAYAGVPVRLEGATLGSLCAIDRVPRSWSDRDLGLLTTLGSLVEDLIVLRLGSLARARAQQEVNEELRGVAAVNRRLQRALLPRPEETTVHGFAVSAAYRAGSRHMLAGGDFADVRPGAGGSIDFVIGDVTGHGPEAAALGAALRSAWNAFSSAGTPTAGMLEALNETLIRERQEPGLMATAIAGSVRADGGAMCLSIAGHPAPVLVSEDPEEVRVDVARGTLLGLADDTRWPVATIPLEGRSVLLFTDGLTEVRPDGGDYGTSALVLEAVRRFCREDSGRSLPVVLLEMATEANGGPLADDAAVLHIRADGQA
jgi:hypothetical protein